MPGDRVAKARRKAELLKELWGVQDNTWMKRARCTVCRRKFVVNNYDDRRVRVPKVLGKPVCPWCSQHGVGARYIQLLKIAQATALLPCRTQAELDTPCKCLPCVARRITDALAQ